MYDWTEYAQTNAQPRPLSDKDDFGICPLKPELEPWEVHTLGLHHPVYIIFTAAEGGGHGGGGAHSVVAGPSRGVGRDATLRAGPV